MLRESSTSSTSDARCGVTFGVDQLGPQHGDEREQHHREPQPDERRPATAGEIAEPRPQRQQRNEPEDDDRNRHRIHHRV